MKNSVVAFHLDLKTSHHRREYLVRLFPRLAAIGYTHVVFEIEDKVRLESIAGAAWHEAWSKVEFAGILAACRQAGLQPVPLIQTLGHLEFLLSHGRYHPYRELPDTAYQLCPSRPESLTFLRRWLDEVIELFGKPEFIHLGADETYYLGKCPLCAARVQAESRSALYLDHLNGLAEHVLAKGVRPMAWADMVLAHPQALDRVSRDLVWVDWDYSSGDGAPKSVLAWGGGNFDVGQAREYLARNPQLPYARYWFAADGALQPWPYVEFLAGKGFDVWIAPATRSCGDSPFVPRFAHLANVAGAAVRLLQSPQPAGLLVTSWALRLHPLEAQWPALLIPQAVDQMGASTFVEVQDAVSATWTGQTIPAFFAAWPQLGEVVPHLHSYLGVDSHCFYYGPSDRLDLLVRSWNEKGFPGWYGVTAAQVRAKVETVLAGYQAAQPGLASLAESAAAPGVPFWTFAGRAHVAKARELLFALDFVAGTGAASRTTEAGVLLLEMEALRDEYRDLLTPIYTPASRERELDMIFASGLRFLAHAAR